MNANVYRTLERGEVLGISRVMRVFALCLVWLCFLFSFSHAAQPQGVEVKTALSKGQALVGEPVDLTLSLSWPASVRMGEFFPPKKLGNFDVVNTQSTPDKKEPDGSFSRTITIRLASFEIGKESIPAVEVNYTGADGKNGVVRTNPSSVEIISYLKQLPEKESSLRPVKPPLEWALPLRTALLIAGGILLGLILLGLLVWYLRRRRAGRHPLIPVVPLLPPDEEALRALAELELSGMAERDSAKAYYSHLSEILRRYLGRRYDFDALEMTSSELIEKVERLGWNDGLCEKIVGDAAESDSVKFARYVPPQPKRTAALERVREMVVITRPAPVELESAKDEVRSKI